jgi:hypothetical protein
LNVDGENRADHDNRDRGGRNAGQKSLQ